MHIKRLIIDGFKSYGVRTEIKGFDPEFNAITGLNGSGKSNILDSICFVLGISNLSNVRATNFVDLIYKSGQAGVTKATVTIVFDNSDPSKSPINYEHQKEITVSRQIVVGGKNRYMINGNVVNNKAIFDFFKSVQLNVNNPHFLIMQGRIAKVLNMKPPEILSMIEEAAGTSMYELKKQAAQKTVEKKDTKLKEMDDMVTEQINPKMQRLKDERSQYFEYQKIQKEVERLGRITTAFKFLAFEQNLEKCGERLKKITLEVETLKDKKLKGEKEVKSLDEIISELNLKIDAEKGGSLQELESQVHDLEKAEAKATAEYKNMENTITSETKKKNLLSKGCAEDEKAFKAKTAEMSKAESVFNELRETQKKDAEAVAAAEKKLQSIKEGKLSSEDGEDASLQDQLMSANEQLKEAETEEKLCANVLEQAQKELKVKLPQLKQTESSFSNDSKDLERKEKELSTIENQLKKANYTEGQLENLNVQLKTLTHDIRVCSDTVNKFSQRYPQLRFNYQDPEPNFDRSKIRGLLCTLFTVKDEKFARAIETAAGGKLYNVVVDNEHVSSKLIKNGKLTKRVTFAPINQIQGSKMDSNLIKKAKNLVGADNVFCAQDLIDYNKDYERVMAWAFGKTFVCLDSESAMRICDSDIHLKSVTLEGDVFDPAGVISGGAVVKSDPILRTLMNLKKAERDLSVKQKEQENILKQIDSLRQVAETDKIRKRLQTEVEMIKARVQHTPHYHLKQNIEELQQTVRDKTTRMGDCKKIIKEKQKKVAELEHKMKNLKTIKDQELKAAQAELKRVEKKAEESKNRWIKREQEYEDLNLEIKELEKAVSNGKMDLEKIEISIEKYKEESAELKKALNEIQVKVKDMKCQVKVAEDEIRKKNSEIKSLVDKKNKLIKQGCDIDVSVTTKDVEKTKLQEDISNSQTAINEMMRKHKWIETDREYFGQPNGLYDFTANDNKEAAAKLKQLESTKEKLDKLVNVKALDVLGSQEEQFQEVLSRKVIVEEDRSKILSVIEELDVKKEEVIKTAWEQVNHDFNSILNSLLPGFNAKLQPVQGKDVMDGLQIKVGLGGIWKESLTELSGGQRSLVALSLILAMLLFKPAPLYILDEVDAALDQSHTQNIGQMLKKHFKQSQFIVVSLKEGMFTNANVLFRASFVDGMSQVNRTTPNQQY